MNPAFVLDASFTLSWAFGNESTPFTDEVLARLKESSALAPALWAFEVSSALTQPSAAAGSTPVNRPNSWSGCENCRL